MRHIVATAVTSGVLAATVSLDAQERPPTGQRGSHVDVYHGVSVADPYRWLEAMQSERTERWVRAQDEYARSFAAGVAARARIRERLDAIANGTVFAPPIVRGDRQFFFESGGGLVAPRVMYRAGNEPATVLLDPIEIDPSENTRVSRVVPSEDGRYLAYALTDANSRWETWRIRDVDANRDLGERLRGLNGGRSGTVDWLHDGSGFFYERFTPPEESGRLTQRLVGEVLAFHALGTPQTDDRVVLTPRSEDTDIVGSITADGRYYVAQVGTAGATENAVHYLDLVHGGAAAEWNVLIPDADAGFFFVGSEGSTLWFMTNLDAPNWKVVGVDLTRPSRTEWTDLIPETDDAIDLTIGAVALGDKIVLGYRKDARLSLEAFHADGESAYTIELPGGGETWALLGTQTHHEAYYRLHSAVDPGTVYRLDMETGQSTPHFTPGLPYDPRDFVTRQVFYESGDGTRIPMYLVHRRDLSMDGENPVFMYGYGAFAWAAAPWFQPKVSMWLQMGGIYAIPNIRGGGEYGERWHQAGIRHNKQTSIDDFLAAGEFLIREGYTSSSLLVGNGGSASGPLIGAAIVQRPDLFAAAVIDFPALDMLRLDAFTGGQAWGSDFGTVEDADDFAALRAYSPYHNVEPGTCFPPTVIAPGSRDEVTVPMHAYKFAAALQHAQSCDNPILLRVSWGAGHSSGATPSDRLDTWADQLATLVRVLNLDAAHRLAMR